MEVAVNLDDIKEWVPKIKDFIEPSDLSPYIPEFGIGTEEIQRIKALITRQERVDTFFELFFLKTETDAGLPGTFLTALRTHEKYYWLWLLMMQRKKDGSAINKEMTFVEDHDEWKLLFNTISPQLKVIDVKQILLRDWKITKQETETLKCHYDRYGNEATVGLLLDILLQQGLPKIKEFIEIVKDLNFGHDSQENLGVALEDYTGVNRSGDVNNQIPEEDVEMEEVGGHSEEVDTQMEAQPLDDISKDFDKSNTMDETSDIKLDVPKQSDEKLENPVGVPEQPGAKMVVPVQPEDELDVAVEPDAKIHVPVQPEDEMDVPANPDTPVYKLRNYQIELVTKANAGENVIINSPPGSGKTIVAVDIIIQHMKRFPDRGKVLFLVPNTSLVNAQSKVIEKNTNGQFKVECVSGSSNPPSLKGLIADTDIFVAVHQVVINDVMSSDRVYMLETFSLIIFDECHHTMKLHPYNELMVMYANIPHDTSNKPQVVGLTATVGIDSASEVDAAVNNILQLCGNLDAYGGIVTVKNNQDEMLQHIALPEEEKKEMDENKHDGCEKAMYKATREIIDLLGEELLNGMKTVPSNFRSQEFEHWCQTIKREAGIVHGIPDFERRDIISAAEWMKTIYDALDIHFHCTVHDAISRLKEIQTSDSPTQKEKTINIIIDECIESLESYAANCQNDCLNEVEREILSALAEDNSTRLMWLVPKVDFVKNLQRWMMNKPSLKGLNPHVFVGLRRLEMTQNMQTDILTKFDEGSIRALICTPDAAGEGIDIPGCNLVIRYCIMKNEIAKVQNIGRVRKRGGKVIEVGPQAILRKGLENDQKIQIMYQAVRKVQRMFQQDPAGYVEEIKRKLQLNKRTVTGLLYKRMLRPAIADGRVYKVLCHKCSQQLCLSTQVVRLLNSHYTCLDEDFKDKFALRHHEDVGRSMGDELKKKSKIDCRNCGNDLGIIATYQFLIDFPLIKIAGIKFQYEKAEPVKPRKWKMVPFRITDAVISDIAVPGMEEEE